MIATLPTQAQPTLRFKSPITNQAHVVGEIVSIVPDNNQWGLIPLDGIPKANNLITKSQIMTWLESKVGVFDYQWKGKQTALIEATALTPREELVNKAQDALREHLQNHSYTRLTLTPLTQPAPSALPLSALKPLIKDRYPPLKQICVRLNAAKQSISLWFKVKAYQRILVAKRKLNTHTALSSEDFILKTSNIAGLKSAPYQQLPSQLWLKKPLPQDAILTEEYLSLKPQVIRGQQVQIKVINQGIAISTDAIAQQDGFVGQLISVMNKKSHKLFLATITAPNQAEVHA